MSSPQVQNAGQFFRKPAAPSPKPLTPTRPVGAAQGGRPSETHAVGVFTPAPQAWEAPTVIGGRPAGFWIRAGAFFIDLIFFFTPVAIAMEYVLGDIARIFDNGMLGFFYFGFCHGLWGQTLGKKLFKIKVVTVEGLPISVNKAFTRSFATLLSQLTLGIGYLMAGWRSDKRALHDLVAKTRVVRL